MKVGERMICPHCGEEMLLKQKAVMDGWTKTGNILYCPLCGKKIADVIDPEPEQAAEPRKSDALKRLFGDDDEAETPKIQWKAEEGETNFCKDCQFLVRHPFRLLCAKHNREVESMDDCPDFQKRGEL